MHNVSIMGVLFRIVCLGVLVLVAGEPRHKPLALRSGDIVLQTSKSVRSALIQRASGSRYSHVGIVEVSASGVHVIEAIAPVSRTPLRQWLARGEGRLMTVLRAKGVDAQTLLRVVAVAKHEVGKPYDAKYRWDDEALYCSELVVKSFERGAVVHLGVQQRLDELALSPEELEVAHAAGLLDEQTLVTPGSLDGDPLLELVARDVTWP